MKNKPIFDVSFFDIDNEHSVLKFKDEDIKFKIIHPHCLDDVIGYNEEVDSEHLLRFRQAQILDKTKTNSFFSAINSAILKDKQYSYIKRVNTGDFIRIVLCEYDEFTQDELNECLKGKNLFENVDYKILSEEANIPKYPPLNKSINDKWSEKYWPMNWKGNFKENKLKQVFLNDYQFLKYSKFKSIFDAIHEYKIKNKLTTNDHITLFYNNKTDEFSIFKDTQEITKFALSHSIINGIDYICSNKNSDDYLLQDYFVLTTHEPCQMCCMALLHSRIKLLLFNTFSNQQVKMLSGEEFSLASYKPLNWEYQVLQYNFFR
ncbi:unnamed protein product [Hanseniaspora opuntiae]